MLTLFSTVFISNSNYCLNISNLPGGQALLKEERKRKRTAYIYIYDHSIGGSVTEL